MKYHILHIIDALRFGGAERMLVDLANATAADGHTVSACLTRDGQDLANDLRSEVRLWLLARRKRFDWPAMRQFAGLVRQQKVDLLHVHGRSTFSFVALVKALGWISTPILLHDHHGSIEIDTSVPPWFRFWGRHFVDRYVGVYSRLAEWAVTAGVPREKTFTIGNAIDLNRLQEAPPLDVRAEFGLREYERIGIVICGIRREKGILQLLDALPLLCERYPLHFLFVGGEREPGHVAICKAKAFSLGLSESVTFTGERSDTVRLMKGADLGVIPSLSESGPLVLIEMMTAGLPFVATLVGDIAHRVDNVGVKEFVSPGHPRALADALDRLLALPPDARNVRIASARLLVQEHFDLRQAMPRWYEIYRECLDSVAP